jgi:glutathione-regulated potassium-efflux system ancillary protein KefF
MATPTPAPRSIVVVFAHPYPDRSRANRVLVEAARGVPGVSVRSLYALYPDFDIDVAAEQAALDAADAMVWQCPFYWYGLPSLLHLWIEKVLDHGWAYGKGGTHLVGKRALWVTTTGSTPDEYQPGAMHHHDFEAFVPPVAQTARFCGMRWEPPMIMHGVHRISDVHLAGLADEYRARLTALRDAEAGDE